MFVRCAKTDRSSAGQWFVDETDEWREHRRKPAELLPDYVFLCTLLSQFRLPQVRSDFSGGAFKLPRRSCGLSLLELDLLTEKLMPSWYGHDNVSIKGTLSHAGALFDMIITQQAGTMQLSSSKSMPLRTFADWYKILNNIASCPYWKAFQRLDEPGIVPPTPKPSITAQTNTEPVCTSDASVDAKCNMLTDACTSTECGRNLPDCQPSGGAAGNSTIAGGVLDKNNNCHVPLFSALGCHGLVSQSPKNLVCDVVSSHSTKVDSITHPTTAGVCMSRVGVDCSWCHRRGHQESSCWRKGGLCLICGGQHRMRNCARYVAPILLVKPICSSCSGDHLGKDCERVRRPSTVCHWCGRQGHLEEACRVKSGACLICGSNSHVFSGCPEFVPRRVLPIFRS